MAASAASSAARHRSTQPSTPPSGSSSAATARHSAPGSAATTVVALRWGSSQRAVAVDQHLGDRRVEAGQPLVQHLRGRRGAEPHHDLGPAEVGPRPAGARRRGPRRSGGPPGSRERGSASTGQPSASARASTASGSSMPAPATSTPRPRTPAGSARVGDAGPRPGPRATADRQGRPAGSGSGGADQRLAERQVQVHGPGGRAGGLDDGAGGEAAPRAGGLGRGRPRIGEPAGGPAEEVGLVDGLRGADVAQLGRAVGGDDEQRHPVEVGLDHGGVELGRRGAAGGEHDRRAARWPGRGRGP